MKAYIIAAVSGWHMMPVVDKFYKSKKAAQKKCEQLNAEKRARAASASEPYVVLCADNWHKEDTE